MPAATYMSLAAALVTAIAWGAIVFWYARGDRRVLYLAASALPMSAAVNVLVKVPVGVGVATVLGVEATYTGAPLLFGVFLFALAPLLEEAAKLAPWALRTVRSQISSDRAATIAGFSVGVGFAVGEALFLGYEYALHGDARQMPWFALGGLVGERVASGLVHGCAAALGWRYAYRGRTVLGYGLAVAVHAAGNMALPLWKVGAIPGWLVEVHATVVLVTCAVIIQRMVSAAAADDGPDRAEILVRR